LFKATSYYQWDRNEFGIGNYILLSSVIYHVHDINHEIWAQWKADQKSEGRTEVDFRIKAMGIEEEALEKRAVSRIQAFCSEIGKSCKIEK